jgi:hypothetical protein
MSATIEWIPTAKSRRVLDVAAPSNFIDMMETAFGSSPWTLDGTHDRDLELLAVGWNAKPNPFQKLREIIERREEIQVDWSH